MEFITINGSQNQGGSQILRDALALSLLTGQPFKLFNFANVQGSGLNNNHLSYIKAAANIGSAELVDGQLGQDSLTFTPKGIKSGLFTITCTASNNICLTLQTILPALLHAQQPSILQVKGGTHFPNSPTVDYLTDTYLPIVCRMGSAVSLRCPERGFYPSGSGRAQLEIHPAKELKPLELLTRGALKEQLATVIMASLPGHIAERELALVRINLGLGTKDSHVIFDNSLEPGNILNLKLIFENMTMLFSGVGQRGVRAETVAQNVIQEAKKYLADQNPVDEHLAHQLILPMLALGGGKFQTGNLSEHTNSLLKLLDLFAPGKVTVQQNIQGFLISIKPL